MKKEDEEAVRRICTAHRWKVLTTAQIGIEVFPNMMLGALENSTKYGALRAVRKTPNGDWAVSAAGLDYLLAAKTENRVGVGVVLLYDTNGALFAMEDIETVMKHLQHVEPQFGKWGTQFYWINASFINASFMHASRGPMTNADDAEVF